MPSAPEPSASLIRAVQGEDARLERALEVLDHRRAALHAELAQLDAQRRALQGRRKLLAEVAGVEIPDAHESGVVAHTQLKGRELRRVAGQLLWTLQQDREIHYREWFEHVLAAGYAVGGKDPAASFLTNVRDSPAVERGSTPGSYRLDPGARDRVRQAIGEIRAELADVQQRLAATRAAPPSDIGERDVESLERLRSHRHELKTQLRRLELEADEVAAILGEDSEDRRTARALQAA